MKILRLVDDDALYQVKCHALPFCWYRYFKDYIAVGRKDGLVYFAGFKTEKEANEWYDKFQKKESE